MTLSLQPVEHETALRRFGGQVVVVTGAAHGIGRACALRFAQEGANVACLDVDDAGNSATAEACRRYGVGTIALHCDVSRESDVAFDIAQVMSRWGRIDALIAAAGIYTGGLLSEVTLQQWQRLLEINLTGVFLCNRAVAPIMIQQRSGSIINISSMSGKTSWAGTHEYSASKSGVIGLTRSVAMELAPYGITVNAVCPGNTKTELVLRAARQNAPREGLTVEEWLARRAADCPMKRLAEPWEIAGLCAFLASEDARYITGQAIEVDGGMVMS
ncbi:MAG: SDR family oxidoreductase [Thermoflexales bacterium]|nr:SDR family oxidoreductase [Thermoflexales bacterium]MDW8351564.1 SDR family NAD(P)-dependent oxidoreductase [Anaerolineae bacterium]